MALLLAAGAGLYLYGKLVPSLAQATWTALVSTFGAGVVFLIAGLIYGSIAVYLGQAWPSAVPKRFIITVLAGTLLLFGLLGVSRPTIAFAGVDLAKVSAGGDVGRWIAGNPDFFGFLRIAALAALTYASVWPGRALAGIRRTPGAVVTVGVGGGRLIGFIASHRPQLTPRKSRALPVSIDPSPTLIMNDADVLRIPEPVARPEPKERAAGRTKATTGQGKHDDSSTLLADAGANGTLPSIELLEQPTVTEHSPVDVNERVKLIERKLAEYGVDAKVMEVNQGPTITQFGLEPGWDVKRRRIPERDSEGKIKYDKDGSPKFREEVVSQVRVKVGKILGLGNDLALALAVPSVRIEAPVPGKSVVGLEVPNVSSSMVSLRRVIESTQFQTLRGKSKLALALGQDVAGKPVVADLAKMPHCLIAGATGSGKSVCVNAIIASILMHATPEEVRLLMVDPKRVELAGYNEIPHLLAPVIVDAPKVVGVLRWVLKEMENRYKIFAEIGVRNIDGYNGKRIRDGEKTMPFLVVIIDELADLMMVASEEVERIIVRLAQLARATGIHLIIATQRPSVDVVTGLIKANVPTRIAFAVSSSIDSRTILDQVGAEKLLGRGDMLYSPPDAAKPVRLQGVYVSDNEIERLVHWWKALRPPQYIEELANLPEDFELEGDEDPMVEEARRLIGDHGRVSTSFLQRRLRIGYNRAARIMDTLEEEGLVEAPESRKAVAAGLFD